MDHSVGWKLGMWQRQECCIELLAWNLFGFGWKESFLVAKLGKEGEFKMEDGHFGKVLYNCANLTFVLVLVIKAKAFHFLAIL